MATAKMPAIGAGNQVVGKVIILYGTVKAISPDGAVRLLAPNSPIFANDRIVTESDGSVSIMMDGVPPSQIDLGRMSNVAIDEDVYAGTAPVAPSDAAAQAEQIQQAILAGDQPIDFEPAAAGGEGGDGGTHPIFVVNLTGNEVTPHGGAETIGVTYATPALLEAAAGAARGRAHLWCAPGRAGRAALRAIDFGSSHGGVCRDESGGNGESQT